LINYKKKEAHPWLPLLGYNTFSGTRPKKIVIIFYVTIEIICIENNRGNSLVVPFFEKLY